MLFFRPLLCVTLLLCANAQAALHHFYALTDQAGRAFNLDDHHEPIVVIVFLGVDCPLAKLYSQRLQEMHDRFASQGVLVLGVDANTIDSPAQVAEFAAQHSLTFPLLKDDGHHWADRLGATRTPEAFVLDRTRAIRYQGAIDDQYSPGTNRTLPTQRFLEQAVSALLAGKDVSTPVTKTLGCFIDKSDVVSAHVINSVTFAEDVAPIFARRCIECHRAGQVGPFPLTNYSEIVSHADTIREVVNNKRMPPWHADPQYGHFANDRSLSAEELLTLNTWLDGGRAPGELSRLPPVPNFSGQWTIDPQIIVPMEKSFSIPATGIVEYQDFVIDPNFKHDVWAQAIEVLPGNRAIVHHVNVYIQPPRATNVENEMYDELLAIFVPGNTATSYPAGLAKRIPAGWRLKLNVHYVTIGSPQSDLTKVGFQLASGENQQVATHMMLNECFAILPGSPDTQVSKEWRIEHKMQLIAMHPHMHLRGRSMRFEATYPGGQTEILLNVPHYDFMWQERYVLAAPKPLPAGTLLRCVGHYDNSATNLNNPDPTATVRPGKLTTDEMFQGNWEVYLDDQDLAARATHHRLRRLSMLGVFLGAFFLVSRRSRKRNLAD